MMSEPSMNTTMEAGDENGSGARDPFPATLAIGLCWIVVYVVMCVHQGSWHADPRSWLGGGIHPVTARLFGSMSTADILDGQWWRTLTATFLHFSVIHLAINLIVFIQLGRMIEPWYGSGLFLGVYVALGALGNGLAAVVRPWLGQSSTIQSGGGSGVICGLIALIAVVGWRARSRFGAYMLRVMGVQLVLVGLTGAFIPNVDNLVHAAGALAGALVGLFDPALLRGARTLWAKLAGLIAVTAMVGAGVAQYQSNARAVVKWQSLLERRERVNEQLALVVSVGRIYRELVSTTWPRSPITGLAGLIERSQLRALMAQGLQRLGTDYAPDLEGDVAAVAPAWTRLAETALREARPDPGLIRWYLVAEDRMVGVLVQERIRIDREFARLGLNPVPNQGPAAFNPPARSPARPRNDDAAETHADATPKPDRPPSESAADTP